MLPVLTPLTLNPEPVAVALEIVTFEFPLFVSVTAEELLDPTFTFPKLRLNGFAVSERVEAATPVPLIEMIVGDEDASLAITMLPLDAPVEEGENFAVKLTA